MNSYGYDNILLTPKQEGTQKLEELTSHVEPVEPENKLRLVVTSSENTAYVATPSEFDAKHKQVVLCIEKSEIEEDTCIARLNNTFESVSFGGFNKGEDSINC